MTPVERRVFRRIVRALEFYADPNTYFAVALVPDHPAGEIMTDFGRTADLGMKPGKRARDALGIAEPPPPDEQAPEPPEESARRRPSARARASKRKRTGRG